MYLPFDMDMCGAWICFHDDTVLLLLLLFAAAVTPRLKAADGRERERDTHREQKRREVLRRTKAELD